MTIGGMPKTSSKKLSKRLFGKKPTVFTLDHISPNDFVYRDGIFSERASCSKED